MRCHAPAGPVGFLVVNRLPASSIAVHDVLVGHVATTVAAIGNGQSDPGQGAVAVLIRSVRQLRRGPVGFVSGCTCVALHSGCRSPGSRVIAIQLGPREPPGTGLTVTAHNRVEGHEIAVGGNDARGEMPTAVKCTGLDHVLALALVTSASSAATTIVPAKTACLIMPRERVRGRKVAQRAQRE
jgi:hypothetical protein